MPLQGDTILWARPRVQNFSEEFSTKYIRVLVCLNGRIFNKVDFFRALVDSGVVGTPDIPAGKTEEEIYAKRWDSYLAPIRPFGLGFNVDEKRQDSPNPADKKWRVSPIARMYDEGAIEHDQFISLQLARTQFPKVTMPLQGQAAIDLRGGAAIQPLRLFVEVVDGLRAAGEPAHLSLDEIAQLARCNTHNDVPAVVSEIAAHRTGTATPDWVTADPRDIDILVNELAATGYLRRLSARDRLQPTVVPSLPALVAGRDLVAAIPWIDVTTPTGIEDYYERLMAIPSVDEREVLNREPPILGLGLGDYTLTGQDLTGAADVVGGLNLGDNVFLEDAARLYRIETPASEASFSGGGWQCTATITLVAFEV